MTAAGDSSGVGKSVRRREDGRLLRGSGCYSADVDMRGQAHAAMVRSPHPHARIGALRTAKARTMPGVIAVLTAAEAAADGLASIPHKPVLAGGADIVLRNRDASAPFVSPHPPLPIDKARFNGEVVAVVVAETLDQARDAAELIDIEYTSLPCVTDASEALRADAPLVWEERSTNVCIDAEVGDHGATADAFARAAYVVRLETRIQRLTAAPMEPRAAVAVYDSVTRRYTLNAGSGNAVRQKQELAAVLGVPTDSVRIVVRDVGGSFGVRNPCYPEYALVAWASRRIGRPVKWTCERQEAFLGDYQARDVQMQGELALDRQGNFLGLRVSSMLNVGAHTVTFVPLTKAAEMASTVYRIPSVSVHALGVSTNLPPTCNYRASGHPEATFLLERLIDLAARDHGFDRVALRRQNMIGNSTAAFTNPLGVTYDGGFYNDAMDSALSLADWEGFPRRRAEARTRGKLRGIAVANYILMTTGVPRERACIAVLPDGYVEVVIGTISSGQGHETSFAQLVSEWLGVPMERVRLLTGDTDRVLVGGGTQSSRSLRLAGIVMEKAARELVAKGLRIASRMLETAEPDIEFSAGRYTVKGTDRSIGLFEVASRFSVEDDAAEPLSGECDETVRVAGFPYGSHVCEVEIDPDTGTVQIQGAASVDDVGRAVNPLIVHGQTHGGICQGLSQALFEQCVYDETGQLLSGSFVDYALPRAVDLPFFATQIKELASPGNPLGIRAGAEGGTSPALAAAIGAICDALKDIGVDHVEMPATPERIWRAIQEAGARGFRTGATSGSFAL